MLTREKSLATLELKNSGIISPASLVTFSQEYIEHANILKEYISKNIGRAVSILTARMNSSGNLGEFLKFTGLVKSINGDLITVESAQNPDGGTLYDDLHEYVIRTDNVLGLLPFMEGYENINPFTDSISEESVNFLDFIKRARNLLRTCLNETHYVELWFYMEKYGFIGEMLMECEILKVNTSNLEVKSTRSYEYLAGKRINLWAGSVGILPFKTHEGFLKKIKIHHGSKLVVDPYDDGEVFS